MVTAEREGRRPHALSLRGGSDATAIRVASFPPAIPQNPYQSLLYEHLAEHGLLLARPAKLRLAWLVRSRRSVDVLHFHWPQPYYRHDRGSRRPSRTLSWMRLSLFAARLATARLLRYRIAWTVHQVWPHESSAPLDRIAAKVLARLSHVLIAHDHATADDARAKLGVSSVEVVPHGSYVGVYEKGRSRAPVREELGLDERAVTFLCFGHVRAYKDIDVLLEAFRLVPLDDVALLVAGHVVDREVERTLLDAARRDRRIRLLLGFVPDERVAELYDACDVAVIPRGDGGTSGALILALSLGLPVVAANTPTYAELTEGDRAAWLFAPGDAESLALRLERAAADPVQLSQRAKVARELAERLDWRDVAARVAPLLHGPAGARRGPAMPT